MQAELLRLIDAMQTAGRADRAHQRPPAGRDRGARRAADHALRRRAGGRHRARPTTRPGSRSCAARPRSAARRSADGVLEAVAALGIDSVRELVGALNRLVAFQAVSEAPLDAAQARLLIGGLQSAVAPTSSWWSRPRRSSSQWRAMRRWRTRRRSRRVLADALPGVMLGQSDMLGGGRSTSCRRTTATGTTAPAATSGWRASRTSTATRTSSRTARRGRAAGPAG